MSFASSAYSNVKNGSVGIELKSKTINYNKMSDNNVMDFVLYNLRLSCFTFL